MNIFDELQNFGYSIKKYNSKTIVVGTDFNRLETIKQFTEKYSGSVYDSEIPSSSIGGILYKNYKIIVKSNSSSNGLSVENSVIDNLNQQLKKYKSVTLKIKDKIYENVTQVIKQSGTPKTDFFFADFNSNKILNVSHKAGSKPVHFSQYGGITENKINNHIEVLKFVDNCKQVFKDSIPNRIAVYKKIQDTELKKFSVYGTEYQKNKDPNSVDYLIQGNINLKPNASILDLVANHIHETPEVPSEDYEPVLTCIYKGDRSQFGIKFARFGINPIGGRKMIPIETLL